MKIIKRGTVTKYAFDNRETPCLRVAQGETFQIETEDAFTGLIADDSDKPLVHRLANDSFVAHMMKATPPLLNPVTGPIYVEDCEAGDVLAVKIDWIEPWRRVLDDRRADRRLVPVAVRRQVPAAEPERRGRPSPRARTNDADPRPMAAQACPLPHSGHRLVGRPGNGQTRRPRCCH